MEVMHFDSQEERIRFLKGGFEEIKPIEVEKEAEKIEEKPKKSAKKGKKEAKNDEIQAE